MTSDDDFQVRPSDFRHAWNHALTRAFQAAMELMKAIDAAIAKLAETRTEVMALAKVAPAMLAKAEARLEKVSESCVADIKFASEVTREELIRQQLDFQNQVQAELKTFMAEFKRERQELHTLRESHEKKLADFETAKNNFEKEKHKFEIEKLGFNKMGLLKRVFFKA